MLQSSSFVFLLVLSFCILYDFIQRNLLTCALKRILASCICACVYSIWKPDVWGIVLGFTLLTEGSHTVLALQSWLFGAFSAPIRRLLNRFQSNQQVLTLRSSHPFHLYRWHLQLLAAAKDVVQIHLLALLSQQGSLELLAYLISQRVSMATALIRFDMTELVLAELLVTWFLFSKIILL